jgi:putative oxidoreductase
MVATFATIGLGHWFRALTGVLEVAGAIGLFSPRITGYAAPLLVTIMVGAIITHLAFLGGDPAPAIALLLLSASSAWLTIAADIRH